MTRHRYTGIQRIAAGFVCLAILVADTVWLVLAFQNGAQPVWEVFAMVALSVVFYFLARITFEGR